MEFTYQLRMAAWEPNPKSFTTLLDQTAHLATSAELERFHELRRDIGKVTLGASVRKVRHGPIHTETTTPSIDFMEIDLN
jgi:hypothetical protein